jgi:hypothetical protein
MVNFGLNEKKFTTLHSFARGDIDTSRGSVQTISPIARRNLLDRLRNICYFRPYVLTAIFQSMLEGRI